MERDAVEAALAKVPLFKGLRPGDLRRLAGLASVRAYRPGSIIVKEDDTALTMYCVLRGAVRVQRERVGSAEPVTLVEFGPGGFFGEMALLDDFPRSATVVATAPTDCALISKWDFERELKAHAEIGVALLRVLSQRVRALDERLSI